MSGSILNKDINLLPKYKLAENSSQRTYNVVLLALTAVLAALTLSSFSIIGRNKILSSNIDNYRRDKAALSRIDLKLDTLNGLEAAIRAREAYQENIDKSNTSTIKLLEYLESEIGNGIHLSGLSDSVDKNGVKVITVSGYAVTKVRIADFSSVLSQSEMFSDVLPPSIQQVSRIDIADIFGEEINYETMQKFSVVCNLK